MANPTIYTTTFPTPLNSTCDLLVGDANGFCVLAHCTGTPPTTANIFAHGAMISQGDSGTGVNAVSQNTGSSAVPAWTLLDTSLGGAATSIVDSNGLTALAPVATASAVNYVTVTNSATGAVAANAVTVSAAGTDAAISLTLVPLGITGIVTIGAATQTGVINVGIATTAATAGVNILSAAGTSSTQTINVGAGTSTTSGGKVVNIATGVPGASTTNTVAIGNGGTTTGTVGITIGSIGVAAHTTLIQGGNGTGASAAIRISAAAAGDIVIGNTAGAATITLGASSTTQAVNVNTGAGVATTSIATGAAANVTKIGGTSSLTTLYGTVTQPLGINRCSGSAVANAPVATLTDAAGVNVTVATGLRILLTLTAGLQAGANTLNLNGHGTDAIKKSTAPSTDIAAYASGGIVDMIFDGTVWQVLGQ